MTSDKIEGLVPEVADMELDLTKDEKLRTTALIMAIRYHVETIVKDGVLYQAMRMDPETHLKPTTSMAVVDIARQFARFLSGEADGEDK